MSGVEYEELSEAGQVEVRLHEAFGSSRQEALEEVARQIRDRRARWLLADPDMSVDDRIAEVFDVRDHHE